MNIKRKQERKTKGKKKKGKKIKGDRGKKKHWWLKGIHSPPSTEFRNWLMCMKR